MHRLLQICNVASITGGTFGCVYSIAKCLPDWSHCAIAVNCGTGEAPRESAQYFPGKVVRHTPPIPANLIAEFEPDAVIFHNISPNAMPVYIDPEVPKFYYQHSAAKACKIARTKCHIWWAVSKYLADQAGIDDALILHQPIPVPQKDEGLTRAKRDGAIKLVIGRICTPHSSKWDAEDCVPFYSFLHKQHPDVFWDFVGCPPEIQSGLQEHLRDFCLFHPVSYTARSLMHTWDAMLYYNPKLPESYGRTVCEAQRCGCVPIVSNLGGFKEQIVNGFDGYLCGEHEEFSAAIRYIKDDALRSTISMQAKAAGDLRGSLAHWRASFLKWYSAVLRAMNAVGV